MEGAALKGTPKHAGKGNSKGPASQPVVPWWHCGCMGWTRNMAAAQLVSEAPLSQTEGVAGSHHMCTWQRGEREEKRPSPAALPR